MRITLAYTYGRHKPDETLNLPDAEARQLLSDGRARLAPKTTPTNPRRTTKRGSGRTTRGA